MTTPPPWDPTPRWDPDRGEPSAQGPPHQPPGQYPPQGQYPPYGQYPVPGQPAYGQPGGWYAYVDPNDPLVVPRDAGLGAWTARITGGLRRSWRSLLAVVAVTQVLPGVFFALLSLVYGVRLGRQAERADAAAGGAPDFSALWGDLLPFLLLLAVGLVVLALLQSAGYAAATWALTREAAGQPAGLGQALSYGVRRMFGLWGWTLVTGLLIVAGLCFCVLPGLYFAFALSLIGPIYLFERENPIGRSWRLTHANAGPVLGRVALLVLVILGGNVVIGVIQEVLLNALGAADTVSPVAIVVSVVAVLVAVPLSLLQIVGIIITYAEQRAREAPVNTPQLAAALG